jgi:hypothetical protein
MARTTRLDHDALDRLLIHQLDVISRRQALAAGVTDNALRHRLRLGGPWRGLLPGVYMAATGAPTTLQQEMAALLYAGPGSVITGPAALRSHHIRCELTEIVDVLVPAGRQRRGTNFVRLHRSSRMPARIWEAGPVRYAMPARAVADAVRGMTSLRDVRAVVADAVQRDKCAISHLAAELSKGSAKGSALFREALADVAAGVRSAAEGDLKDLLARSGLPMPLFNPSLYDEDGAAARCAAGCDRGSQTARSRLTRHLVWDASSVAGSGNVPILSFGLIARTSPTAHGPCMYMPAWLLAKAWLPSA